MQIPSHPAYFNTKKKKLLADLISMLKWKQQIFHACGQPELQCSQLSWTTVSFRTGCPELVVQDIKGTAQIKWVLISMGGMWSVGWAHGSGIPVSRSHTLLFSVPCYPQILDSLFLHLLVPLEVLDILIIVNFDCYR